MFAATDRGEDPVILIVPQIIATSYYSEKSFSMKTAFKEEENWGENAEFPRDMRISDQNPGSRLI
jgi:hypothetical protein